MRTVRQLFLECRGGARAAGWLPAALLLTGLSVGCDEDAAQGDADGAVSLEPVADAAANGGDTVTDDVATSRDEKTSQSGDAQTEHDAGEPSDAGNMDMDMDGPVVPLACSGDAGSPDATTQIEFACTTAKVRSCENIGQVELEFADGATQKLAGKHGQTGVFAGKGRNAGKHIVAATISAMGKMQQPQATRFESDWSVDDCAQSDAGEVACDPNDEGCSDAGTAPGKRKGRGKAADADASI